jgi:protoporphyrinogen oxidase
VRGYGEGIARRFLLNYSEKLWGLPAEQLSRGVAGRRLAGVTLRSLFKEIFPGKTADDAGSFYYPLHGYGTIAQKLAAACGEHHITRNAPVLRLVHDGRRIVALEIAGVGTVEPSTVISTIPLGTLVHKLDPRPAPRLLELARRLRSRNLLLVAFFLRRERVTLNGSIYFPDHRYPMTRVCEPNNRSPLLSPDGRTSLVVELPCDPGGERWALSDAEIVHLVQPHLERIGWVTPKELIGTCVQRMEHAYPMLPLGVENDVEKLLEYLSGFENLRISGRSGRHAYTHVHDELRSARQMIDEETLSRTSSWRRPARLHARPLPGPVGVHPANPP